MHLRFLLLAIFALICACDLNDAPTTTDVTITPRLQVINGTTIPETDSVEVKLWSSTKVWYAQTLPWSAKSVTITGVPVGTEYTISLIGRSKQSDGSQFVWWNGSQTGTATASKTVDARTLTVPVTVYTLAHDSTLSGLSVSSGVMSPSFDKSTLSYRDTVENSVSSVTVLGSTLDGTNVVTYTVDGGTYTSSGIVNLTAGAVSTVSVKVANANGNSLVYTIAVYRKSATVVAPPTSTSIPWQTGITYGSVTHAGQTYMTVVIGTQTWMAENLNYAGASGTVGVCYNNSADSCAKYGRLYTWTEVMQGSVSSSASPSGVQGICPDGWHVPSDAEWTTMQKVVDATNTTDGTKLKSTTGWYGSGSGTDQYGFRALPGGFRSNNGSFNDVGGSGGWWSATEDGAYIAWSRGMGTYSAYVRRDNDYKTYGFSLRCSKDEATSTPPSVATAHDSTLSGLSVSSGVISPSFSKSTLSYRDTVENSVSSVTVLGSTLDGTNVVTYSVGGGSYSSSGVMNLTAGAVSTVSIKVTNANGNSLVYTIAVYRKSATVVVPPTNTSIPWQTGITYGSVTHGGQTYKTVVIGTQTWMAENLNYAGASGTVGVCYNNSADSCAKYGRLYTWSEVMQGSVSSSASPSGVQGLCPDGWHVPSDAEWTTLENYVDAAGMTEGTKLKSTSGWYSSVSGTDTYGFRALPGGYFNGTFFSYVGGYGYWWSATEGIASNAWNRSMGDSRAYVYRSDSTKTNGFSLRCSKDAATTTPPSIATPHDSTLSGLSVSSGVISPSFTKSNLSYTDTVENSVSSVTVLGSTLDGTNVVTYSVDGGTYTSNGIVNLTAGAVSSVSVKVTNANGNSLVYTIAVYRKSAAVVVPPTNTSIPWQTGITYGSVTHGGQTYKTVVIGTQTWMAENLNYAGASGTVGVCYNNSADSCAKYGRLYTWAEVMQGSVSSTASPSGVQGICPDGWHVPSDAEWTTMQKVVDATNATDGTKLKSTTGWYGSGSGTDQYGFRALPSGNFYGTSFYDVGNNGNWWSATEYSSSFAWFRYMDLNAADVYRGSYDKTSGFSLRCSKD